jgi:hypothetical protein
VGQPVSETRPGEKKSGKPKAIAQESEPSRLPAGIRKQPAAHESSKNERVLALLQQKGNATPNPPVS